MAYSEKFCEFKNIFFTVCSEKGPRFFRIFACGTIIKESYSYKRQQSYNFAAVWLHVREGHYKSESCGTS